MDEQKILSTSIDILKQIQLMSRSKLQPSIIQYKLIQT